MCRWYDVDVTPRDRPSSKYTAYAGSKAKCASTNVVERVVVSAGGGRGGRATGCRRAASMTPFNAFNAVEHYRHVAKVYSLKYKCMCVIFMRAQRCARE